MSGKWEKYGVYVAILSLFVAGGALFISYTSTQDAKSQAQNATEVALNALNTAQKANDIAISANQPQTHVVELPTNNGSIPRDFSTINIYNDETHTLTNFNAESFVFFNMTYQNVTTGQKYMLLIPVLNYYQSPITSYNGTGFIAQFTVANPKESNIDEYMRFKLNFVNYTKSRGNLTLERYVYLSYDGFKNTPINEYYSVSPRYYKSNSNIIPSANPSIQPVDFLNPNVSDILFDKWINLAQLK